MGEFGHEHSSFSIYGLPVHLDTWGAGPFCFRIDGNRVFFEDSDRFGPAVLRKRDMLPSDRQPGEKSRFWDAYGMWRKAGRPTRGNGKIKMAIWTEPKPGQYWKDSSGLSHFLCDPDLDHIGYVRVEKPRHSKEPD